MTPTVREISALRNPNSSSACGRSPRTISRTSSTPSRAVSWSCATGSASSAGAALLKSLELQHHAGQGLADLVVQLARQPPALVLLGHQGSPAARPPLVLEAVEHRVEGVAELRDLGHRLLQLDAPARRNGSTRRISSVRRSSGPNTRRSSTTLTTITSAVPANRTAASVTVRLALTVAGENASTSAANDESAGVDRDHAPEQGHG